MKHCKVLMVCLGNICRSPTAQGVFQAKVSEAGLSDFISVDSAGTSGWHIGEAPDSRSQKAAKARGYDLSSQRGRQVDLTDFDQFDYILAMDEQNLSNLRALAPKHFRGHLGLFTEFSNSGETHVPDPYYGSGDGFERVLDLVEDASEGLLKVISKQLSF